MAIDTTQLLPLSLSLSLLALLSFPALTNSLSRTERKSMPLTVDFGNQRWVLARRKLVWGLQPPVSGTERALPVIGIDKSRLQRGFFSWSFLPDNSFGIWTYFFRLKVFARGPCWSEELTAAAIKKDENVLCVWRFKLSSDEAVFFFYWVDPEKKLCGECRNTPCDLWQIYGRGWGPLSKKTFLIQNSRCSSPWPKSSTRSCKCLLPPKNKIRRSIICNIFQY